MHDTIDWTLVGRVFANEATDEERQQLERWLAAHPEQQPVIHQLYQLWQTPSATPSADRTEVAAAYERLQQRIEAEEALSAQRVRPLWPSRSWLSWAAAASVILLLGFLGWTRLTNPAKTTALLEQANPKGIRSQIRLADGTTVWLNADSHLRYPKSFTGDLREVSLEGEAFFRVAHNPKQPFVVRLATGSVRVLGTSFNIRAYPGDSTVETSVVTGRVAFVPNKPVRRPRTSPGASPPTPDTLFLTPNLKAIQSLTRQSVATQPTVATNQIAWTESKLVFRNTPMGEVAKTLERWYGTPVTLERESLRQCPLTGTFQNQSLQEVMTLISMTNRFQYELTPSQVTIKGPGCDSE
ncbi:ferric-dicitrate binding protein FerR (iron transport regulator) [Spirosoma lacussanchae]|uniref:FecR domain-containing protein n=1 Tax=Spirosoma lacussanchae TaxID=1884249 RepID=UPI001107BAAB|nr:FecR domain-containing protein [Spirosoma lacussanchae]